MINLPNLQPKLFTFEHDGFTYEGVGCLDMYTGNWFITLFTPEGTRHYILDNSILDFDGPWVSKEDAILYNKIIRTLNAK